MPKKAPEVPKKICFVIAPIGEAGSETRRRSDQILKHVIEPCAEECGYDAIRADRISEPGLITAQVLTHIIEAPMVIADLTEHNPNVFYELAIRHAVAKPLVQMIRSTDRIPFDVAGMRTIPIDHQDLDSVAEAKVALVTQIRAVEADPSKVQSPLSTAINLQNLRASDQPLERLVAEMTMSISELQAAVGRLDRKSRGPLWPSMRRDPAAALHFRELPWSSPIENPPNFIDPKRYTCRVHRLHPQIEAPGDGTVTLFTCCDAFLAEAHHAITAGEPG
jgi:hypothetical protein